MGRFMKEYGASESRVHASVLYDFLLCVFVFSWHIFVLGIVPGIRENV